MTVGVGGPQCVREPPSRHADSRLRTDMAVRAPALRRSTSHGSAAGSSPKNSGSRWVSWHQADRGWRETGLEWSPQSDVPVSECELFMHRLKKDSRVSSSLPQLGGRVTREGWASPFPSSHLCLTEPTRHGGRNGSAHGARHTAPTRAEKEQPLRGVCRGLITLLGPGADSAGRPQCTRGSASSGMLH